jgi:hypothetical protein
MEGVAAAPAIGVRNPNSRMSCASVGWRFSVLWDAGEWEWLSALSDMVTDVARERDSVEVADAEEPYS